MARCLKCNQSIPGSEILIEYPRDHHFEAYDSFLGLFLTQAEKNGNNDPDLINIFPEPEPFFYHLCREKEGQIQLEFRCGPIEGINEKA